MSSFVRRLQLKILRQQGKIPPRKKELKRRAELEAKRLQLEAYLRAKGLATNTTPDTEEPNYSSAA